jgi:large subunit ribosomal protein L29
MKQTDIKGLSIKDLLSSIESKKMTIMKLKISNKVSQLENPMQLRFLRREIARYSTELKIKETQEK